MHICSTRQGFRATGLQPAIVWGILSKSCPIPRTFCPREGQIMEVS